MKQSFIFMLMLLLMLVLVLIMILISVAFLTLMERKFLSYIQIRKGPNKLGISGVMQPFSDAIKLLSKEIYFTLKLNYLIYLVSPMMGLILIILMWMIYPMMFNYLMFDLSFIYLMCCFSFSGYMLIMSGWSSNSTYSMLGSIRSLVQCISFEVSLVIIMLVPLFMIESFNLKNLYIYQLNLWFFIYMFPLGLMFFFSIMAELNRTPFDFSEGESELVSGFNIEYMSSGFVLIFLSEYASILFLSFFYSLLFLGGDYVNLLFYFKIMMLSILIIWVRGTLPRFRYDLLMYLCWLLILPFTLNYMFYMIFFKIYIF